MISKPKGTYDLIGDDAKLYTYASNVIQRFMENYNYDYIRTPIFEATELYHRGVGEETDIVSKETYDFKDRGERSLTLRPEGTAGAARLFIENKLYGNRNDTIKLYYNGTMYRYERPQAGRNREFTQFGAEVYMSNDVMSDAEVISMGYYLLLELGLDDITVNLNCLGDKETRKNYSEALKAYLKPHLTNLCPDCNRRFNTNPLRILDCKVDSDSEIFKNLPSITNYLSESSKKRFETLKSYLINLDVNFEVNDRIVRGLDYYDENVWEYINNEGITVGAGGRYNSLVATLDGPDTPAVGFALGLERVIIEMKKALKEETIKKYIDVFIMSVSEEEKIHALNLSQNLRLNGVICEINSNNLSLKSQFKLADALNTKFIIILNNEELQKGLIKIKDNATKEETLVDEADVLDWILANI